MGITNELRAWASVVVPYRYGHQLTASTRSMSVNAMSSLPVELSTASGRASRRR